MDVYESVDQFNILALSESNRAALLEWGVDIDTFMVLDTMTVVWNLTTQMVSEIVDNASLPNLYRIVDQTPS